MQWIRDNIHHFGGDSNNITIFGQSAGASSVHYHLLSDYSSGLFHKAIIQSGSAFNTWAHRSVNHYNEKLAQRLGWDGQSGTKGMMNVLMEASAIDIVAAQDMNTEEDKQNGVYFVYLPIVEPYNNGNCFLERTPKILAPNAWGNEIPLLIGGNSNEGYVFFSEMKNNKTMFSNDDYFTNGIPRELNLPVEERLKLGKTLKKLYYGNERPTTDNLDKFTYLVGDKMFWHGLVGTIRNRNNASKAKTFLYRLNFNSKLNLFSFFQFAYCGKKINGRYSYLYFYLGSLSN